MGLQVHTDLSSGREGLTCHPWICPTLGTSQGKATQELGGGTQTKGPEGARSLSGTPQGLREMATFLLPGGGGSFLGDNGH